MIGSGGLLYCLDQGIDVPGQVGLAGFNGLRLLDGLPRKLATMDACRADIGRKAAQIIAEHAGEHSAGGECHILKPKLDLGETLKRAPRR